MSAPHAIGIDTRKDLGNQAVRLIGFLDVPKGIR
jgi:hypothetical protein